MDTMTLDERVQLAYPTGAPTDVVTFLRGEWTKNAQGVYLSIEAQADDARRSSSALFDRLLGLRRGLDGRKRDLATAEAEMSAELLSTWPLEHLVMQMGRRNALASAVDRIAAAIEEAEAGYNATLESGAIANWKELADLAAIRIKDGIPPAGLAAKFNSTPEELTPAWRWERHVKQEQEREQNEERRRLQREERERLQAAKPYTPPAPTGCNVCDHEKHWEIHAKIFAGMTQAHIDALSKAYSLTAGAIVEHYNGHPILRPKLVISVPQPPDAPPSEALTAGFGPR